MKFLNDVRQFLSGWKSWLVALVATGAIVFPEFSEVLGLAKTGLEAVPGDATPAFSAQQAALVVAFLVATVGRFAKAVKQYKSGVPVKDLNS